MLLTMMSHYRLLRGCHRSQTGSSWQSPDAKVGRRERQRAEGWKEGGEERERLALPKAPKSSLNSLKQEYSAF